MGQDVVNSEIAAEGLADPESSVQSKPVEYSYTREKLLSFADLESCKKRPESLDPVVWRDAPAADGTEAGIAIPAISRGLVRREREGEAFSKSPVDIPEWRKDSWRSGGSGAPLPPGSRRKPYDEETPGNAFSTSYPPRPAGNWGDNGHSRNSYERSGLQGQGSGRWEHRAGFPDREREQGRIFQKWDGEETVSVWPPDALRTEGLRPFGSTAPVVRPGWLPAERDGLLGSGGGLHRTYTGNFTTPSALRASLERQMSMGPPERQMSMGLPERQMGMGPLERQMSMGPAERQMGMGMGPPERQMSMVPLERQTSMVPLERQMSIVPPERQMSIVPSERPMSIVLPERQMSIIPPERQMSMGPPPERQMSMGPPGRQMSMGPPERQMSMGPLERQMSMGPPERQMGMGPLERQMSMGPPERQMSMGPPERQMSMGRMVPRHSDPYHASRPLKGPAFVRREDTDFINDETFGSEESSTDDRAEQERKRRESFELMRKDHHRLLQKQQKLITQKHEERLANPESNTNRKHDESSLWDSTPSAEGMPSSPPHSPEKNSSGSEEVTSGSVGLTPVVAPSTPRPAIPPGFAKVLPQMQTTVKAPSTNGSLEEHNIEMKDNLKQTGMQSEATALLQEKVGRDEAGKVADNIIPTSEDQSEVAGASAHLAHSEPAFVVPPPTTEAHDIMSQQIRSGPKAGEGEEWSFRSQGIADKKKEAMTTDDVKEDIFVAVDEYNKSEESLLDKWFGRSSDRGSVGVLPSHPLEDKLQNRISKEDGWSDIDSKMSKMSKFAQWFHPEESQPTEGASDILSLFPRGGALKDSSSLSEVQDPPVREVLQRVNSVNVPRNHGRVLPMPSGPSLEDIEKGLTASASSGQDQSKTKGPSVPSALSLKKLDVEQKGDAMSGIFGEHSPVGKFKFQPVPPTRQSASRSSPVFLTCADIEQSMLAEAGTSVEKTNPNTNQSSRAGGTASRKDGQAADSAASRHLLSLLQKGGAGGKHFPESSWSSHTESLGEPATALTEGYHDGDNWGHSSFDQGVDGPSTIPSTDTTLEALFGKAFMSELRSVEAPVSANAFASNSSGNTAATQPLSSVYPVSRQSGRVNNSPANSDVSKQWPGTIGPLASMGWTENNVLEANRRGHLTDMRVLQTKVNQYVASSKDDIRPVTSGHGLWGNGVSSHMSDGSLPFDTSVGVKDSFVSSVESTSFVVGDVTDSYVTGKGHLSRVQNPDVDMRTSSKVDGDGKSLPSGNVISGQLKVSEDSTLALSQVISSDEPVIGPSRCFDSSGLPPVFKDDGLTMRMVGDGTSAKLGSADLLAISREEDTAAVSQVVDSFLLASRKLDRKEMQEDVLTVDKIGLGDDAKPGNDRKMADALSDTLGFIGKGKDESVRVSTISTGGFPEQANAGLTRANSGSMRFKSNVGGLQPTSGFSAFQPVGTALQHQQSIGAVYRSDNPTSLSLQLRQQSSIPVHHHLHQNSSPAPIAMFPQQFLPQQGLPQQQQQQLLGRTFSNGSSLEFPHVQFGHAPSTAPSRPLPAGHPHFPPSAHLMQPGAYHPMGHMGPTPNHFLPPAQIPQRGPVMSPMAEAIFMQEQALHDPHGLGSKQQGPSLFPLGGHALQSGQGPMFHQPLPHNLRGQQNQLLPGPAPWVVPYSSELMRTASKGHELAGFANGSGGAANSLDRWFGMELSRNVSGIPTPGLMQLSAHGLDAETKMRFG